MKRTITLVAAALALTVLLSGCSSDYEGMSLKERWKAMADRQDADARAFVAAD
jgi:hypothetical protein